jgi:hypothetical protein
MTTNWNESSIIDNLGGTNQATYDSHNDLKSSNCFGY